MSHFMSWPKRLEKLNTLQLWCWSYLHRFRSVAEVDVIQTADRVTRLVCVGTVPPYLGPRRWPWTWKTTVLFTNNAAEMVQNDPTDSNCGWPFAALFVISPSFFYLLMWKPPNDLIMWTWCVTFGKTVVMFVVCSHYILETELQISDYKATESQWQTAVNVLPVVVATMLMSVWTDSISCACCLCRAVLLLLATLSCLSKASMAAIWVLTTDWETNIHSCWTTFSWPQTSYIMFRIVSVYISQLRLK